MDDEPEVIRQQMDDTRSALADKLGRLEQQVVDTVHGAVESVENVKKSATETVENVRHAVQDTVDSVTKSVRDTVDTVTDTLDLQLQVEKHPWTMVAGAAAVGFVGGFVLYSNQQHSPPPASKYDADRGFGRSETSRPAPQRAVERPESSPSAPNSSFNWLSKQTDALHPAMEQLKGLALGTVFGVIKDLLTQSLPKPMESQICETVDGITVSLGGKPIRGHVLPERTAEQASPHRGTESPPTRAEFKNSQTAPYGSAT